jgi:hypothetical protein
MTKPTVFISYSHKDEAWKDRVVTHLGVLQKQGMLDAWDDRRIGAGQDWYQEIQDAMDAASVALLLVSADFLASEFITSAEVPRLLERRAQAGVRIVPLILRPCDWQGVGWLKRLQAWPTDGRPLSAGDENQIEADLAALVKEIRGLLLGAALPPEEREFVPIDPDRISTGHLPITGRDLFGRQAELTVLDQAWADPGTNVLSLGRGRQIGAGQPLAEGDGRSALSRRPARLRLVLLQPRHPRDSRLGRPVHRCRAALVRRPGPDRRLALGQGRAAGTPGPR